MINIFNVDNIRNIKLKHFGSGLTYTIHDSTPIIYGNTCSTNDFMSHIDAGGLHGAFDGGIGGAILGGITGRSADAFTGGLLGAAGGFLADGLWTFGEKGRECWF